MVCLVSRRVRSTSSHARLPPFDQSIGPSWPIPTATAGSDVSGIHLSAHSLICAISSDWDSSASVDAVSPSLWSGGCLSSTVSRRVVYAVLRAIQPS
ncbi:hypothetical protein ACN38_g116 [Penicillium nordicum]|uniref:Uncharacterized protein n=1 Tax=Penicillium nordicum TaxID=229535 RepID=A0A0M9WL48_9EURO|nr:hypothetical protein ACN38_g116 [Penicillium nordicum]